MDKSLFFIFHFNAFNSVIVLYVVRSNFSCPCSCQCQCQCPCPCPFRGLCPCHVLVHEHVTMLPFLFQRTPFDAYFQYCPRITLKTKSTVQYFLATVFPFNIYRYFLPEKLTDKVLFIAIDQLSAFITWKMGVNGHHSNRLSLFVNCVAIVCMNFQFPEFFLWSTILYTQEDKMTM